MAKQPASTRKIKPHTRRTRDKTSAARKLPDSLRALIWQLTEEGLSQRAVAEKLDIGRSSVTRELATDPAQLEQIRAVLREARSERWKRAEGLGVDEVNEWLGILQRVRGLLEQGLGQKTAKKRKDAINQVLGVLAVIPKVIQATKGAAGEASRQVQVLTGGVTDRIGGTSPATPEDLVDNPEMLIEQCIAAGCVDMLSPVLKAAALKRLAERSLEKLV
jgi:IS30 family transposase